MAEKMVTAQEKLPASQMVENVPWIMVKAQSHYDDSGAPLRDPGSTGMNRGSTGMNRGSIGDDRDEPGETGAPPGKY
ncbi:hypothetical protein DPMN_026680 [Dreissena polymorpha]|uniref:Uncharacterized protein n=1 Tax=Dreissena polymorpha TaxID=45954 RepID=A0A9D4LRR9_DREPO|nr:hypothetical protein DPMN_026680 [Dreissena polymorpha]